MEKNKKNKTLIYILTTRGFVIAMGIVFVAGYILMNTLVSDYFMSMSNGNAYVETNIFYASSLGDILQAYGETGRVCYIKLSVIFDFILPMQYSLFFVSCSILLLKKFLNSKWQKALLLLGMVLCLSDWFENIFIIFAIINFPKINAFFPIMAQTMTLIKSAMSVLFLIIVFVSIVIWSAVRIKERKQIRIDQ